MVQTKSFSDLYLVKFLHTLANRSFHTHTHTHLYTHIYIYTYIHTKKNANCKIPRPIFVFVHHMNKSVNRVR